MHALALIASSASKVITPLLPRLKEILHSDSSTIVRDHALDTIGNYAMTGKRAAQAAHPILIEALTLWDGKHATRALNGLSHVAAAAPGLADELRAVGYRYGDDGRGVVRKAAKSLIRAIES